MDGSRTLLLMGWVVGGILGIASILNAVALTLL
jgi:hypothetical protein